MSDDLINRGVRGIQDLPEARRMGLPGFDMNDPEQRVSAAFCGLSLMVMGAKSPLETNFDENPDGRGVWFSVGQLTGPGLPPPQAKAGEAALRAVHWDIQDADKLDQAGAFSVLRTQTVQVEGAVYRPGIRSAISQRIEQREETVKLTPDQLIADFQAVALNLLPTKYRNKLAPLLKSKAEPA